MNEPENNKILPNQELKITLNRILGDLMQGKIPDEDAIQKLRKQVSQYNAARKAAEPPQPNPGKEEQSGEIRTEWKDILPDGQHEVTIDDPFFEEPPNVSYLKRLVYEKIVADNDGVYDRVVDQLISTGVIAEVTVRGQKNHLLTSKGWDWISTQKTKDFLFTKDPLFLIPEKIVPVLDVWPDAPVCQMDAIREYFTVHRNAEFMIFVDDVNSSVYLGCEIRDTLSVVYCSASGPEGYMDSKAAARIFELAQSDKLDGLVIAVRSQSEENRLKMQRGLDPKTLNKLRYFILTEEQ